MIATPKPRVVPLISMLRYRRDFEIHVPTIFVLSAQTWADVLFRDELLEDELLEMERRNDGFALILTLTREAPQGAGDFDRRVDMMLRADAKRCLPVAPRCVFVCGANPFVNAVAYGAIAAGIDRRRYERNATASDRKFSHGRHL